MYKIFFSKQAARQVLKMPRDTAILIREKLEQLAQDPLAPHSNVTRLQNREGYRLRVADWRIIFEIQKAEVVILVIKVAQRGEVYR